MNPDTAKIIDRLVLSRDGLRKLDIADYAMIRDAREAMADAANALTNYAKTFAVIEQNDQAAAPHLYPASGEVGEAVGRMSGLVQIIDSGAIPGISMPVLSGDLKSLLSALSSERERAEKAEKERDEAREQAQDDRETLKAWFELAEKVEGQATETVISGLKGYLRTAKNGGMDTDVANAAQDVLEDYCRLYFGRDLVPVLRGMSTARAQAAEAKVKEAVKLLSPLASAAGFIDSETTGFQGDDTLDLTLEDIVLERIKINHLRAALRWTEEASQGEGE